MKDIYNIYESLLGDIESSMEKGQAAMDAYLDTVEERIINIITLAGNLDMKESIILRGLIAQIERAGGEDLISHFPTKLRDMLIATSKRRLKVKDFKNLRSSVEAYDRYCNTVYNLLQSSCDIKSVKTAINETPNKIINASHGVQAVKLGDAIIFVYKRYMYIKIKDVHRIVIEATDILGF
jgi:hypothetical protein